MVDDVLSATVVNVADVVTEALDIDVEVPAPLIVSETRDVTSVAKTEVSDGDDDDDSVLSSVVAAAAVLLIVVAAIEVSLTTAEVTEDIDAVVAVLPVDVALSIVLAYVDDTDVELLEVNVDISVRIVDSVPKDSARDHVRAKVVK